MTSRRLLALLCVSVLGVLPPGSVLAQANPLSRESSGLWRGSGTSQATAVTSGAAALLLSQHPTATPAQVKASLRSAADPLPGKRDGAGLGQLGSGDAGGSPGSDKPSLGF